MAQARRHSRFDDRKVFTPERPMHETQAHTRSVLPMPTPASLWTGVFRGSLRRL